jgi:hypothetical protein
MNAPTVFIVNGLCLTRDSRPCIGLDHPETCGRCNQGFVLGAPPWELTGELAFIHWLDEATEEELRAWYVRCPEGDYKNGIAIQLATLQRRKWFSPPLNQSPDRRD